MSSLIGGLKDLFASGTAATGLKFEELIDSVWTKDINPALAPAGATYYSLSFSSIGATPGGTGASGPRGVVSIDKSGMYVFMGPGATYHHLSKSRFAHFRSPSTMTGSSYYGGTTAWATDASGVGASAQFNGVVPQFFEAMNTTDEAVVVLGATGATFCFSETGHYYVDCTVAYQSLNMPVWQSLGLLVVGCTSATGNISTDFESLAVLDVASATRGPGSAEACLDIGKVSGTNIITVTSTPYYAAVWFTCFNANSVYTDGAHIHVFKIGEL